LSALRDQEDAASDELTKGPKEQKKELGEKLLEIFDQSTALKKSRQELEERHFS
jgi:hypothetical protein